jgi:hypothetical protein
MKTLSDIYASLARSGIKSDKGDVHSYLPVYETLLAPYRPGCKLLEIGLFKGDSMRLWEAYFPCGEIHGIDLCDQPIDGMADLRPMIAEGTHNIILMNANDPVQVEQHFGTSKFDVIIEDSSHAESEQLSIYRNFRDKLAPGGMYVIEDVQDIDHSRATFEGIDPERSVEILDRRHIKGRYDDVLVVIR